MKVETVQRDIQRSENFQERAMGLAVGSESFVFNVLRKDLYSDPIGSLIREYAVNAQDEHKKYGVKQPIFIQVPSTFSPELHIRDYANGLTEEQVFTFFGQYGASDKRDSNDVVGFYGLGCKSAFAYTDSYVVKSFKDGMAYTFNIYIDETEIGRVAKISEEKTDEPNGVLIIVPVKTKDISDFQRKVLKTVTYFTVKPVIEGLGYVPEFDTKESKIEGDGWKFFGSGESACIMGEISYPINTYAIDDLESWEEGLLNSDLHLYTDIGEVQVTASREALQMSPKTIEAIRKRLVGIKGTMMEQTEKSFSEAKTLFEAKSLYYTVVQMGGVFGRIVKDSGKDLVWNGIVIDSNSIKFDDKHWVTHYTKSWRGKIQESRTSNLKCGEDLNIYFDDVEKTKLYRKRAETLLASLDNVVFLHTTDVKALETAIGMPVTELNSLFQVVPVAMVHGGGAGVDLSKRAKHTAKVFQLNMDKLTGYYRVASEVWDVKEVDLSKGGVFIPIERFKPRLGKIYDLDSLRETLSILNKVGINTKLPIYGLKNTDSVKGMVRLDEWITRKLNSLSVYKKKYALMQEYDSDLLKVAKIDESKLIGDDVQQYIALYKEAETAYKDYRLRETLQKAFRLGDVEIKPPHDLSELSKKISERYPLLPLIDSYQRGEEAVVEYMNEIDEKKFLTNIG